LVFGSQVRWFSVRRFVGFTVPHDLLSKTAAWRSDHHGEH
jgi:hypothetical protein